MGEPVITLRPVAGDEEDEAFLFRVYAGTRDDITGSSLTETEKHGFLALQFTAQHTDYRARFPDAEHSLVLVDGKPWGRIWIDRRPEEIRLLDIALLPERRNRGVGRVLLERLMEEAAVARAPLRHSVYKENADALRFYRRLGFEVIEDFGLYLLMEWRGRGTVNPGR